MRALASAGAGFLLAVLWFDLMFDIQVRGHVADVLPEQVRTSIATVLREGHDRRPTDEPPRAARHADDDRSARSRSSSATTFPTGARRSRSCSLSSLSSSPARHGAGGGAARRTRRRRGDPVELARGILRDHLVCITAIVGDAAPAAPPRVSRWRPKAPTDHIAHTGSGRDQVSNFKPYVSSNPRMQNGRSGHSGGPPIVS